MIENPMRKFLLDSRLSWNKKEGKKVSDFLEENFLEFETRLDQLIANQDDDNIFGRNIYIGIQEKRQIIRQLSHSILKALNARQKSNAEQAQSIFNEAMNKIQHHLVVIELKGFRLFRIRPDIEKEQYDRKELFHVPFEKADFINAGRYSLTKKPCLYLGGSACSDTGLSLCWFETNMPTQFYWSEFKVADHIPSLPVIDFVWSPFSSATATAYYQTQAHNKKPNNNLLNYIITYPLQAACSLPVTNKSSKKAFPEYIIPQMLLMWLMKSEIAQGVAYPSSSEVDAVRFYNAFNVALPVRSTKKEGYCSVLEKEFKLSKPIFMNTSVKIFKPIDRSFIIARNSIYNALQNLGYEPLREMMSIIDDFLLLHAKMKYDKAEDKHIVYNYFDNLNLFSETIFQFENHYKEIVEVKIKKEYPNNVNQLLLEYSDAWIQFKSFRELLRQYWNFFEKEKPKIDNQAFEYICS